MSNPKVYTVKVYEDRTIWFNEKDQFHREEGPAVEWVNGSKFWYLNGKLHQENGPAVEYADDDKHWFINGKYHREDGPAVEYADGNKFWYLNGKQLTEEEFNNRNKYEGKVVEIDGKKYKLTSLEE